MSTLASVSGVAGDDLDFTVTVTYDGAPLNLSGYDVAVIVKPRPTSADADGTVYAPSVTDAAAGKVSWTVPHADTAAYGDRSYRVKLTDSSGRVATAVYGTLTLVPA